MADRRIGFPKIYPKSAFGQTFHRHIDLPQSMTGLQPRRAGFEGDVLLVDLVEAV